MTVSPEPVLVAPEPAVEPLIRAARASIAMLSLQLRTAQHKAELAERSDGGVDMGEATTMLRRSLDERLETRRLELQQRLDAENRAGEAVIAAAREDAAAIVAEARERAARACAVDAGPGAAGPDDDSRPVLRRSLHIVTPSPALDWRRAPAGPPAEAAGPSSPAPAVPDCAPDSNAENALARPPRARPGPRLTARPRLEAEPEGPATIEAVLEASDPRPREAGSDTRRRPGDQEESGPAPAPESWREVEKPAEPPAPMVVLSPATLSEIVQSAVVAALAQAGAFTATRPQPVVVAPAPAPGPGPSTPTPVPGPEGTLRSRFLHPDIVLPMVAVLVVFVILLAWVG